VFTEQDTFDRLRRIPYEEMRKLVNNFYIPLDFTLRRNLNLFKDNGWTLEDYNEAVYKQSGFY